MVKSEDSDVQAISVEELDSMLSDLMVPPAVFDAQNECSEFEKKQMHSAQLHLFFSFDIVNSTMYKTLTGNWPVIIRGLLEEIRRSVLGLPEFGSCYLWRAIGDEMIFVIPVQRKRELALIVDSIFEVTQQISISLKNGKFFETIKDQSLQRNEIDMLKTQNLLSIKTAAWIAVINDIVDSPYDSITFNYSASSQNLIIKEYLGRDIDAGFRLKSYTQDRRLAVSFELAYFLLKLGKMDNLYIMDYVRLKGVWNESLYPIIWYYSVEKVQNCNSETLEEASPVPFIDSFRYDEINNNMIAQKFFFRKEHKLEKIENSDELELLPDMYRVESAINKIIVDKNLIPKIKYFESKFVNEDQISRSNPYAEPLEMHCAVVCCDVKSRKVLISQRTKNHRTNPGKWEFGCAKAVSEKTLISSMKEEYKKSFGIDIELVIDKSRQDDVQPLPIAVYEINNSNNIKKGIIFVAKVLNPDVAQNFRPELSHICLKWIGIDEINHYKKEETVSDFHQTLNTVFNKFDELFPAEV